jgi:acyl-CoA thioesterase
VQYVVTVAAGCSIEFLAPVYVEDELTAEAERRAGTGRTGIYDVTVTNRAGETVALFRGRARRLQKAVIEGTERSNDRSL